jgi:hypothetical protein
MSITLWITILVGVSAIVLAVVGFIQHKLWTYGCIIVAVICLVAVVILQKQEEYEERGNDAIYMGILEPGAKYPIIPASCTMKISSDAAVLSLGRASGAILDSQPQIVALKVGRSFVKIRKQGASMALDALVLDGHGNFLVKVNNNRFTVNPNNVYRDRVHKHTLFVYDTLNRLVLYVDFRNDLNMYLIGTFSDVNSQPLVIQDKAAQMMNGNVSADCFIDVGTGWSY